MTTIKDLLLAALRGIGADGVADGRGAVITVDALQALEPAIVLITSRPAFRDDDDGSLVPLPEGWEVRRHDDGRAVLYYSLGGAEISFAGRNNDGDSWGA